MSGKRSFRKRLKQWDFEMELERMKDPEFAVQLEDELAGLLREVLIRLTFDHAVDLRHTPLI